MYHQGGYMIKYYLSKMGVSHEVTRAKVEARKYSRELIQTIFMVTEIFPKNDPENLTVLLRKKALSISSFLSHGTVQSDKDEQGGNFIVVMTELRALLRMTVQARQLGYMNDKHEALVRLSISDVITRLDQLVKLLGSFD